MQEKTKKEHIKKGDYQYYQYFLWSKKSQKDPKNSFIGQQLSTINQQFSFPLLAVAEGRKNTNNASIFVFFYV